MRGPLGAGHWGPGGGTSPLTSSLPAAPPQLLGPSCSWEDRGLHCSCSSRAQPAPSLHWRLGEGLLDGNFSNASIKVTSSSTGPWANSSLSLGEGLSSSLRLSCEAQNVHGAQSATVLLQPGQRPTGCPVEAGAGGDRGRVLRSELELGSGDTGVCDRGR